MFVTIITDSEDAPVEIIYFLLGAGYDSVLQSHQLVNVQNTPLSGDFIVANVTMRGSDSSEWLSMLPINKTAILFRNANPGLRRQLRERKFIHIFQFPAQIKELGDALRSAAMMSNAERSNLLRAKFKLGNAELDMQTRRLGSPQVGIVLTSSEARALGCLAKTPGIPVSRRQIEVSCGSSFVGQMSRKIDVLMSALRNKLEHVRAGVEITGVRGIGYQLNGNIEQI